MPHAPLCALVIEADRLDPRDVAASARHCLADIRLVLARAGFERAANGILLASMAVEDDLRHAQEMESRESTLHSTLRLRSGRC